MHKTARMLLAAYAFACAKARVGVAARVPTSANGEHAPQGVIPATPMSPCFAALTISSQSSNLVRGLRLRSSPTRRWRSPPDAVHPKVFELFPLVYDVLAVLDDWTDRSTLGATPEVDELVRVLAEHGLVEVHG
jgi:hypothetical protein